MIRKLRSQPEEVRTHVLHVLTVSASAILLLLWVYSLGTKLADTETKTQAQQDLKPFSVLKDNLVGGYKSLSPAEEQSQSEEIDMTVLE